VFAVWAVVLAVATVGNYLFGGTYSNNFTLPASPSARGEALLQANEPAAGRQSGQLVFTVASGALEGDRAALESAVSAVRGVPHVLSVTDPLSSQTVSADGRTAVATVHFDTNPQGLGKSYVALITSALSPASMAGVTVDYGGALGQAAQAKARDSRSALIGVVAALVVLLLGFGSIYAAGLPLVSAALATATGLGILGLIASSSSFPKVSPTFAVMMGLGVGIDYALFLAVRHRQQLIDGADPGAAAEATLDSSGRAVLVAVATVILALLSLYASGIAFMGELGVAGALTVAVAGAASVTLVPALFGVLGQRIDRYRVRRPVAEATTAESGWGRYAHQVGNHPWRYLLAGLVVLFALAAPIFSMRLGHIDAGADPGSFTDKRAYDHISSAFGKGANGPFTIAVKLPASISPAQLATFEAKLHQTLSTTQDVAAVSPAHLNPSGQVLITTVTPKSAPQDAATGVLQSALRRTALPTALAGTSASAYVTGTTSEQLDFRNQIASRLPLIISIVLTLAFVLLLANFRSPVLALKAAVLNLLSIGAAYGVIVAVFQWGWGRSAFGVSENVPIESYVAMIMFAVIFGLSMDYEVFLLSRTREVWLRTGDNDESVATGLAATARVITCAALIMTSVFLAFLLSTSIVIKMLALGLAVSIVIDASIIRLLVVPAAMFLFGKYNWWTPRWLSQLPPAVTRPVPATRSVRASNAEHAPGRHGPAQSSETLTKGGRQ